MPSVQQSQISGALYISVLCAITSGSAHAMRHATGYIFGQQQRIPDLLLVFQSSMHFQLGLSDYYEEYMLENPHAEHIEDDWDAFIDYRRWELINS